MISNTLKFFVLGICFIGLVSIARAEGVDTWIKGSENTVAAPVTTESTATVAPKVVAAGGHSLDEIIYKVSRAKINLENYGSDLDGHGPKAIQYLSQALEELKKAKQ